MKTPRKLARIKRTANGKIMGRPVKRSGVERPSVKPKPIRWKRYLSRLRDPGRMICPATGEIVECFGPPKPVYEWREVRRGRPSVKDGLTLLRIVKVHVHTGQRGFAEQSVARKEGHSVVAVKQELRRARRAMRDRTSDASDTTNS